MRKLCLVLVAGALLVPAAGPAAGSAGAATVPDGPRLALARISLNSTIDGTFVAFPLDVFTADAFGGSHQTLIGGSLHDNLISSGSGGGVSWSPDGSTLAFPALRSSRARLDPTAGSIYLIGADGSGLRRLTRVNNASSPVFSTDGRTIYFERNTVYLKGGFAQLIKHPNRLKHRDLKKLLGSSIWAINADGTGLQQLTPEARGFFEGPSSVSPLTGDLAISRSDCRNGKCSRSARLLSPATGGESVLVNRAVAPVFSPDGKKIALNSFRDRNFGKHPFGPTSELYVLDTGTGALQRLTYSPGITDGPASWDPSGNRLAYLRSSLAGSGVREINADGTCATPIAEPHGLFGREYSGVAWQPGASRGAGPIAC